MIRTYVLCALACGAGFTLGMQYENWSHPNVAVELQALHAALTTHSEPPARVHCTAKVDALTLRQQLTAALIEAEGLGPDDAVDEPSEMAVTVSAAGARDPEGALAARVRAPEDLALTPEMLTLYDQASTLVRAGIENARWTASDVDRVRPLIQSLDAATRQELMVEINAAINSGKMVFESEGAPF